MGVTLTAFANGATMDPAVVTSNITTIADWLDGQIVTADIATGSIPTRAFAKLDHYASFDQRSHLSRTVGVTGKTYRGAISDDPAERVYATIDSHGTMWEEIATMAVRFYAEESGRVEGVFEWWAWATQSDRTYPNPPGTVANPETIRQCDFRLALDGSAVPGTNRGLWDASSDGATSSDGGPYCYPARNFQAIVSANVSAGWHVLRLQVNHVDQAAAGLTRAAQSLVIIGARNRHLEYWRR